MQGYTLVTAYATASHLDFLTVLSRMMHSLALSSASITEKASACGQYYPCRAIAGHFSFVSNHAASLLSIQIRSEICTSPQTQVVRSACDASNNLIPSWYKHFLAAAASLFALPRLGLSECIWIGACGCGSAN